MFELNTNSRITPLFDAVPDIDPGVAARDEGAARVLVGAEAWRDAAIAAIQRLAETQQEITADDLREALPDLPPHQNCFGAVWLRAAKLDIIERTDRVRRSSRQMAHAHANPIWRSRIFQGRAAR